MTITLDMEEVTTEDVTPSVAPFVVSAVNMKNFVTFKMNIEATGMIKAVRSRFHALNRNAGGLQIYRRGMVCGSGDRCGSVNARSLSVPSPFTPTVSWFQFQFPGEPDGEYTVAAWAMEPGEWSS